jgi:pentose-5-phosphate-3-epimerase
MPEQYNLNYTADLMCLNPEQYFETLVHYGFDEIIIHVRSLNIPPGPPSKGGESAQEQIVRILKTCEKYDLKLYLAIDMKTNFSEFTHMLQALLETRSSNLAGVQVMGIENIGLQGQEFKEEGLEIVRKIKELKSALPEGVQKEFKILFDGGINEESLLEIKNAGVDVFCVGHLLTEGDFVDNLKFIKKILN